MVACLELLACAHDLFGVVECEGVALLQDVVDVEVLDLSLGEIELGVDVSHALLGVCVKGGLELLKFGSGVAKRVEDVLFEL